MSRYGDELMTCHPSLREVLLSNQPKANDDWRCTWQGRKKRFLKLSFGGRSGCSSAERTRPVRLRVFLRSYLSVNICCWDPLDGSKYPKVLLHGEDVKDDVELRADPHQLLHLRALCDLCHRGPVDGGRAVGGGADAAQDVHERGLPGAAVSQQGGYLALVDVKCQA